MSVDIHDFLTGLFDERSAITGPAPAPESQLNGTAEIVTGTAATPTVTEPASDPFAEWVLRPDVSGVLGWEPPDLPEAVRWWARATFDDLPAVPAGFCLGGLAPSNRQDCARCVPAGRGDALDLLAKRPAQQHFHGFGGA